jgi:predicted enzyme related to lactoylglutathione lyase
MHRKLILLALGALLLGACAGPRPGTGELALTDDPLYGKFVWADLITDDVAAAKNFYGELFGWRFEDTERPGGGPYTLIVSRAGRYVGGMVEVPDPGDGRDYSRWLPYLAVPDADRAAETTAAAGGEIIVGAEGLGPAARVAVVSDPQGAVVGLINSRVGYPEDGIAAVPGEIHWRELLTADDLAAVDFYAGLAGYETSVLERNGGRYVLLRAGGLERAGVMQRPDERVTPLWLTHFRVDDPGSASDRAASLGGEVILTPSEDVRGGNLALVTDPGGALLAMSRVED